MATWRVAGRMSKDARKLAIRRVKMATDTVLEKIEAMAEEAVAQAMKKRKLVH